MGGVEAEADQGAHAGPIRLGRTDIAETMRTPSLLYGWLRGGGNVGLAFPSSLHTTIQETGVKALHSKRYCEV